MVHLHAQETTSFKVRINHKLNYSVLRNANEKKGPTNFGLHIGEDITYIEGKLLSEGSVFGDGDSIARIIKSLL